MINLEYIKVTENKIEIPSGYKQVLVGIIQLGDLLWSTKQRNWVEVTEAVLTHLGFLDAMSVNECVCVIRK
jgi:hypothetical protein